ncbi:MAG TPA: hypothetical protein VHY76_16425 [Acetobacteraceae bacterium]|jgi:hypothetical protein|nr:hypothetical protein [Acetobacteraceae bacterium]
MTVESLPGRRWEWMVWEQGNAATARRGTAGSAQAAMQEAEAASAWFGAEHPESIAGTGHRRDGPG